MIHQSFKRALDLLYPRRCPVCDGVVPAFEIRDGHIKRAGLIHRKCLGKIEYVKGATCAKCGKPLSDDTQEYCEDCRRTKHNFDRGYSVFAYRTISGSIYRFKYMGRQEYAEFYGWATAGILGRKLKGLGIEAIVPVPMYPAKERKRGYNQAAVYAEAVSAQLHIPVLKGLVRRVRNTAPMKELDARGRRNNLKKAFIIAKNDVKFKCVLIIDDIYTTGSTIDEIAHEFRMAGVQKIYCLTLAIGQTT
ncbi:ComF family protein [Butyrivibrio sp. FCS006]|uniref:ComF family protein n=1 Tax=Butyrivibrio sp. FCS006 TaxID=1280684 RepID=UPI00047EEBBC|nr:ComF family protein [Butyrivibrio sp. FCS006]